MEKLDLTKIRSLLKERHVTIKQFCTDIDISEQGFAKMMRSNSTKLETLLKICRYFGVEIGFFCEPSSAEKRPPLVKDEATKPTDMVCTEVPFVSTHAQAGTSHEYGDPEFLDRMPKMPVITDREFKGQYIVFEVQGDSMDNGSYRSILPGDKILAREVNPIYWTSQLHLSRWFFVIVHKTDGIFVKEITSHDVARGTIVCHSLNDFYPDFEVNLSEVAHIYNVISIVQRNMNH